MADDPIRSPEKNPGSRKEDQGFWGRLRWWWGPGNGYRDVWLFFITGLVLLSLNANRNHAAEIDNNAVANRALTCATARLVSFVPALQFEGEPRENFLGWLESRRDMLVEIRERSACDSETQKLLEERVELDQQLLGSTP